jgi:peptidoglycan hydrolase-like protein with peptidoglycan-binding domain
LRGAASGPDLASSPGTLGGCPWGGAGRQMSRRLRAEGFTAGTEAPLAVDGDYGPETAAAVRQFQELAGITVDGTVGQETRSALGETYCWKYH